MGASPVRSPRCDRDSQEGSLHQRPLADGGVGPAVGALSRGRLFPAGSVANRSRPWLPPGGLVGCDRAGLSARPGVRLSLAARYAADPTQLGRRLGAGVGGRGLGPAQAEGRRRTATRDTPNGIGTRPISERSSPNIVSSVRFTNAPGMASSLSSLPVTLPNRRTAAIGGKSRLLNGDRSSILKPASSASFSISDFR